MSPRAVQRFIAELENNNLIKVQQRGHGQSNIYYVDKSILIHNLETTTTEVSSLTMPFLSTLDTPKVAYPYKGRKDNFKRKLEKITAELVDNLRMQC